MIVDELATAIETRLKAQMASYFYNKVYQLPSEGAFLLIENNVGTGDSGASIVYRGSTENPACKVGEKVYDHNFDIFGFRILWGDTDAPVKGFGTAIGLLKLLKEMRSKLDNYIFTTELAGKIISARVTNYLGTRDWITTKERAGYAASIGLSITYKEFAYE